VNRAIAPTVVIQPRARLFDLDLRDVWQHRELLYFLVWRDVKLRYKQTALGASWAILQPVIAMLIFNVVFNYLARMPSEGLPYALFAYTGLLPWLYFAKAIERSGNSLVSNTHLVTKTYFPRLILPLSALGAPLIDFGVAFVFLFALMAWYGFVPGWPTVFLPLFVLLAIVTSLAVSLFLSALNVRYRDVAHIIPFFAQIWMFASPVVYPVSLVPERWRLLYGLNPMAGVIDGFRWALLGTASPDFRVVSASAAAMLGLLLVGIVSFRNMERTFADVI
jgi:lipopolysaccharide transport system permease protein